MVLNTKLFISPPFGNYINMKNSISILGTFTLYSRNNLVSQIFKTLRYDFENNGWINKIGLQNPGIEAGLKIYKKRNSNVERKDIISIFIGDSRESGILFDLLDESIPLEINLSCPNLNLSNNIANKNYLQKFTRRDVCIAKVSPLITEAELKYLYSLGFRQFHASNTLPILGGGLSGPALRPFTQNIITFLRTNYSSSVYIIAGGGIYTINDAQNYIAMGADAVSISSLFFTPWRIVPFLDLN